MELWERDGARFIMVDGYQTASSYSHGSDDAAAELAVSPVRRANQPTFLLAGIGLGFTLAALERGINREKARFVVAEPSADLIHWHRTHLQDLHPGLLDDTRLEVEPFPALVVARRNPKAYHAILMRLTHGRVELTVAEASDYFAALRNGGLLLITVAKPDSRLKRTLSRAGFDVSEFAAPVSHKGKKTSFHTILLAKKGQFVSFSKRGHP